MPTEEDRASTFIVRVWYDPSEARDAKLRGSVEHIQTGRRSFFAELDQMREFVAEHVKHASPPAAEGPDRLREDCGSHQGDA